MALYVRELSGEERTTLQRLARAERTGAAGPAGAAIILRSAERQTVPTIASDLGLAARTVRIWVERFCVAGLDGLDDASRSGRPRTYTEDQTSRVIAKARSVPPKPASGEIPPTCHWTLDRLQAELQREGLPIGRSQIRRILRAEHIKWQKPRTWLESDDPDFAEKRGPSSSSTPIPRPAAPSCV